MKRIFICLASIVVIYFSPSASAQTYITDTSGNGYLAAEAHRSSVVAFSDSLMQVASQVGAQDIGGEIRAIAEEQRSAEATATEAIEKITARGPLRSFLFGSDYTNLGILKSQIVRTESHINELNTLLSEGLDSFTRAVLETQIGTLKRDQANVEQFMTAHDTTNGLFGWFTHLVS